MVTAKIAGETAHEDSDRSRLDRELRAALCEAEELSKTSPQFRNSYTALLSDVDWEPESTTTRWIKETKEHLLAILKKMLTDPKLMELVTGAEVEKILGKRDVATEKKDDGLALQRLALHLIFGLTHMLHQMVCDYEQARKRGDIPGKWDALPPHQAQLLQLIDNKLKEIQRLNTQDSNEQDSPDKQQAAAS